MGLVDLSTAHTNWNQFWFNNWIGHQGIVQAIAKQKHVQLTMYDIDPWIDEDKDNIIARHFQYHNEMNFVLGIGGQDLSVLDFKDPNAVQQWVWQHFNEHQAANAALR